MAKLSKMPPEEMLKKFPKHVKPLADRIIIFPTPDEDTYVQGGIIHRPDNKKFKKTQGTVMAAGDGKYVYKMTRHGKDRKTKVNQAVMELVPGDKVCYNKYSGVELGFNIDGEEIEFMIMPEREILSKIGSINSNGKEDN